MSTNFVPVLIGCGVAGLTLLVLISQLSRAKHNYPNGPTPLPFVGNIGTLRRLKADRDRELVRIRDKWGNLCMLWYGSTPVVIINSPRAVRELLNDRGAIYSSRPEQNEFRRRVWPWRLVSMPAGDDFRFLRKLYHNCLNPQQSALLRKYQDHESKVMLQSLLDRPEGFLQNAERYTMSVIFSAVYGVRLDRLDHPILVELNGLLDASMKYFEPGTLIIDFLPVLQHLPLFLQPWHRKIAPLVEREISLHFAFLKTLRKAAEACTAPDCFAKLLIEVQEQEDIDDLKAVHILAMLIGAGADTSGSILQGFFKIMALNPEAVQKAQEELDRVVGSDRMPTWEDEPSLPYMRSLVKEVHRFGPIGSLGIPHCATTDDIYEGNFIPKSTIVFPNLTALSKDPERYPNPEAFEPDRFRGDIHNAAASALSKDHLQRDHFHYGFGRRLCPGLHVAEASLFIVFSRVLWGFEIRPRPGHVLDMDAKIAILINKPKPYKVDIICRGPGYAELMRDAPKSAETGVLNFDDVILNVV